MAEMTIAQKKEVRDYMMREDRDTWDKAGNNTMVKSDLEDHITAADQFLDTNAASLYVANIPVDARTKSDLEMKLLVLERVAYQRLRIERGQA
jgi:phage terminase large subunit-like protein